MTLVQVVDCSLTFELELAPEWCHTHSKIATSYVSVLLSVTSVWCMVTGHYKGKDRIYSYWKEDGSIFAAIFAVGFIKYL